MKNSKLFKIGPLGIEVSVKVATGASKSEIAGTSDNELKIRIAALPIDGKANKELIETIYKYVSKTYKDRKIKKADIEIIRGLSSKRKVVRIRGLFDDKWVQ
ncbi:protein of unknown function DUF167 [Candidatus Magnetoovum chiemensis]|nr:protein of unknown function DUF167 [Candidatus Magnetoovum chiemensis]